MKLSQPFLPLPVHFNPAPLEEEIAQIPESSWKNHPAGFKGNTFVRLISLEGEETDKRNGPMAPTSLLENCPVICGVLAHFETVVGATRLMRLSAGHEVPSHIDISPYWARRVRVHVPILTSPKAIFQTEDQQLHMPAGSSWTLDNWRRHSVKNTGDTDRIHLVFDSVGSPEFWQMAGKPYKASESLTVSPVPTSRLNIERAPRVVVASPDEVEMLVRDIVEDLMAMTASAEEVAPWLKLITEHCQAWRSQWMKYGNGQEGWAQFENLLKSLKLKALGIRADPLLPFNQFSTRKAILGRLLPTLDTL